MDLDWLLLGMEANIANCMVRERRIRQPTAPSTGKRPAATNAASYYCEEKRMTRTGGQARIKQSPRFSGDPDEWVESHPFHHQTFQERTDNVLLDPRHAVKERAFGYD